VTQEAQPILWTKQNVGKTRSRLAFEGAEGKTLFSFGYQARPDRARKPPPMDLVKANLP
jgi:hypothetical protein